MFSTQNYDGQERWSWMMTLAEVLARVGSWGKNIYHIHGNEFTRIKDPRTNWTDVRAVLSKRDFDDFVSRRWYYDQYRKYEFHPAVKAAVWIAPPLDWHRLVLELPHISESDPTRIAYTRDNRDGLADRQLITTVGKYLHRHFPVLPDHVIRDLTARYAAPHVFRISRDMGEMVNLLHQGPTSCMVWDGDDGIRCADGIDRHPYEVYDPALGWGLAVRLNGHSVDGRALVCEQNGRSFFVRTYKRGTDYSYADEALHHWLESQGYTKLDGYPYGTKLRYYSLKTRWGDESVLAPFIDGNNRYVDIVGDKLEIVRDGAWLCDNTDGRASEQNHSYCTCPDCEERVHEDSLVSTYDGAGESVCESCIDNNYYYVYGRREYQYYVHSDDMIEVRGTYYHGEYLHDNNIVELENGEYEELDYAIEIDGCWYSTDDDDVVLCQDTDEYAIAGDGCWRCGHSNNWYSDSADFVELCEIDDKYGDAILVHPDYLNYFEADLDAVDATLTIEGA